MMKKMFFPALLAVAALAAACGGGGGGSQSLPSTGSPSAQVVPVAFTVKMPAVTAKMTAKLRKHFSEAQSTQGFTVSVNTTPVTTASFNMQSTNTTQCVTSAVDNSYTCTFSVNVAPGSYTFSYSTYDAPPLGGVIPGTAHKLGIGSQTATITNSATPNTLTVVLNGIAVSASVSLPIPVVRTVNALTQQATIAVMNADNDLIVSNSYVDASGNPLTVTLSSNCPLVTVSPATITAPLANGATVTYSPTNLTATEVTGGSPSTDVIAQLGAGPTFSAQLVIPPAVQTVTTAQIAYGITAQSASSIWVTLPVSNQIQNVSTTTGVPAVPITVASPSGPLINSTPAPKDILFGPDGNLYMTFSAGGFIGRITPAGGSENGTNLYNSGPFGVSLASDGTNIWTTQPTLNYVEYTPTSSWSINQQNPTPSNGIFQIAKGTGGYMYYTAATANVIGASTTGGSQGSAISLPAGSSPEGIAWDGANTLWVAESGTNKIAQIVGTFPLETIKHYSTGSFVPTWIAVDAGGNAWFDFAGPTPGFGKVTPSGNVTTYPLPTGTIPWQMVTAGSQIWLVDNANAKLYGINY